MHGGKLPQDFPRKPLTRHIVRFARLVLLRLADIMQKRCRVHNLTVKSKPTLEVQDPHDASAIE